MALLDSINNAIKWLEQARREIPEVATSPSEIDTQSVEVEQNANASLQIAWGSKVSPIFKERVLWTADALGCDPNYLMACMAWESGESFSASKKNMAGSGATGLIQFMPNTAKSLGTTVGILATMTAEEQLRFVYEYFKPMAGRLHNLGDVYMTILWPKGVNKPDNFVLFDRSKVPTTFRQNAGLDVNHDGLVTRAECLVKVNEKLAKGLQQGYVG